MQRLWDNLLYSLRRKVDTNQFDHWFRPIVCESVTDEEIVLQVPDQFFQEWLEDNYLDLLRAELSKQAARDLDIRFTLGGAVAEPVEASPAPEVSESTAFSLDPRYTFGSFVVGSSNQFAHAASIAVSEAPGQNYNPLFIYGGVGLGKTHLLQAIGHQIQRKDPGATIQYIAAESYINDLIGSIRRDQMDHFRAKYRKSCDVLLVDDIQFIAGKDRTQIEFFHTFNSLYGEHKQIVLTSDRFPQEIAGLEERLRSRFQWGLIADIQAPELETRVAILNAKAASDRIDLPEDVAMFLAQNVKSNVRELEGSLIRLAAYARLTHRPIDLATTRSALRDILQDPTPTVTIQQVQRLVATHFNVTVSDLKGGRRHRAIALPRMIAMYLIRSHTRASFPEIGRRFGGRDHSTVISAVNKIKGLSSSDEYVRRAVTDLERSLTA